MTRARFLVPFLFVAACGGSSTSPNLDVGVRDDMSAGEDLRVPEDLSSADLRVVDLTSTRDLSGPRQWAAVPSSTTSTLFSVWGTDDTIPSVWAVGSSGTVVKSVAGGAFAAETGLPSGANTLFGVSGTSLTMYAVGGSGTIWRRTGTTWTAEVANPIESSSLSAVSAVQGTAAYASGANSVLLASTGTAPWTPRTGATNNVNGIWAVSATNVYAVGQGNLVGSLGKIYHSGGSTFTEQTVPSGEALFAVGGTSATDIYAVGRGGVILHSTGNGTWTAQTSGTTENLNAVAGVAGEVYVVGDAGTVLVSNDQGTTWTAQNQGTKDLYGVWVGAADVFVVGSNGVIYHR